MTPILPIKKNQFINTSSNHHLLTLRQAQGTASPHPLIIKSPHQYIITLRLAQGKKSQNKNN